MGMNPIKGAIAALLVFAASAVAGLRQTAREVPRFWAEVHGDTVLLIRSPNETERSENGTPGRPVASVYEFLGVTRDTLRVLVGPDSTGHALDERRGGERVTFTKEQARPRRGGAHHGPPARGPPRARGGVAPGRGAGAG